MKACEPPTKNTKRGDGGSLTRSRRLYEKKVRKEVSDEETG